MPAGRPKQIAIGKIRTDGDTQVRCKLDDATVIEYAEKLKRGKKLPQITLFYDGKDFWLGGGFHRLAAWKRNDAKTVPSDIHKGSKEDAAWFALSDNSKNGLRLNAADKERAIKKALKLKPQTSNRAIADMIDCDDHTVAKYRKELESTAEIPQSTEREGADGRTCKVPPRPVPPVPQAPKTASEIPTLNEREVPHTPSLTIPTPTLDHVGVPIPPGEIADAFARGDELKTLCSDITRVKSLVKDALKRNDPLYADITPGAFDADITNVYRALSNAKPYAVCPYCGGAGCKACKNRGWVNKITYDVAPKELKK